MKTSFFFPVFLLSFLSVSIFSQNVPTARSAADITLHVTLTDDRGKFVSGLNKDAFAITRGKELLDITSFSQDEPAEILVLLDNSKFMSGYYRSNGEKQSFFYEMISLFLESADASDAYSVYAFNKTLQPLLESTNDKNAVLSVVRDLDALKFDKLEAIYDACYFGVEKLSQSSRRKKVLLVFTRAAVDSESRHTAKQLREAAKRNNVLIYNVGITESLSLSNQLATREQIAAFDTLGDVTPVTGGQSFYPRSPQEAASILGRLGLGLKHQYTLGIKFNNTVAANKWHRLKVRVTPPKGTPRLSVRNQEEFFVK